MRPMNELVGRELIWRRTRLFASSYELVAGDTVVATVVMRGLTRRSGTIRTAEGEWVFRRTSLFSRDIDVAEPDGTVVAVFDGRILGGEIRVVEGAAFRVATGVLPGRVQVYDPAGSLIVTQRWAWPPIRRLARVEIAPAGSAERQLGLLAAVAFVYLVYRRRAAARSGG